LVVAAAARRALAAIALNSQLQQDEKNWIPFVYSTFNSNFGILSRKF
jgi:hypothetical protein